MFFLLLGKRIERCNVLLTEKYNLKLRETERERERETERERDRKKNE